MKKDKKRRDDSKLSSTTRRSNWQIPIILTVLISLGVIVALAQYYSSMSSPMECYQCSWISRPDGPSLVDDPCGKDQRSRPNNVHVKTCAADQKYCGTLHISLSYFSTGKSKNFEFAFIRDCFAEYPIPYVMQIADTNRTYYGSQEGTVYTNLAGLELNMTVVGRECAFWKRCNSNTPRDGLGWAFLDSVDILYHAKQKGLSVWKTLIHLLQEEKPIT